VAARRDSEEGASEPRFEEALATLERLVSRLESGELDLEQSLAAFEQGVALARTCSARLEAAELRLVKLEAGANGRTEREISLANAAEDDE
jgi:exodeoxyribonuclease VII small subunit